MTLVQSYASIEKTTNLQLYTRLQLYLLTTFYSTQIASTPVGSFYDKTFPECSGKYPRSLVGSFTTKACIMWHQVFGVIVWQNISEQCANLTADITFMTL